LATKEKKELAGIVNSALAYLEVERELGEEGLLLSEPRQTPAKNGPSSSERRSGASKPDKVSRLDTLAKEADQCQACELYKSRNRSVFSRGTPDAELLFVGEGPGQDEDREGIPFVGQAGQLLDRMIAAMGYGRDDVYICNVVKCRPPQNRTPFNTEVQACERFLTEQILLVSPKVIVALGKCAALALNVASETGDWRGQWRKWHEIPTMPTYHPAFLLRSPKFKRTVWEDLQEVMKVLGKTSSQ
jgi:uracil-DNA glycosylase